MNELTDCILGDSFPTSVGCTPKRKAPSLDSGPLVDWAPEKPSWYLGEAMAWVVMSGEGGPLVKECAKTQTQKTCQGAWAKNGPQMNQLRLRIPH